MSIDDIGLDSVIMSSDMIEPAQNEENLKLHILNVKDRALAIAGFRVVDGDRESVIVRHAPSDTDFQIKVELQVG